MISPESEPRPAFTPGRRYVLKAGAAGAAALLVAPAFAEAADSDIVKANPKDYPLQAFLQKTEQHALADLYNKVPEESDKITLDAPEIAENGAVVPVNVSTELPSVTGIALLALDNPYTLACAYKLPAGTMSDISSRLKLAKTTKVIAIIESNGKLYSTSKLVKVTLGGCG